MKQITGVFIELIVFLQAVIQTRASNDPSAILEMFIMFYSSFVGVESFHPHAEHPRLVRKLPASSFTGDGNYRIISLVQQSGLMTYGYEQI